MDNRTEKSTLQKELQDTNIKLNNTAEYTNWLYQDRERVQNENNQLRRIINNYQRYRINPAMQFITNGHQQQQPPVNFNLTNYKNKGKFWKK